MSKYLVTGGAGFIGSAVIRDLIKDGNDVVTVDNLSTGSVENIHQDCKFVEGDIFDQEIINQLDNERFDAIIHIAGQSSGEISFEDPVYDLRTNAQSTIMLLDYAKKSGCNNFIYASTMSVYGDQEDPYVDESTLLNPKSFYAVGKIASENYMKIYSSYGIRTTVLRLFNVYGVGQNMTNMKQGMFSIFLAMALEGKHINVRGTKDRFRDFVYIDDVVRAFKLSIDRSRGEAYETYNICCGEKHTVEDLVMRIDKLMDSRISVEYSHGTPGDQFGIHGNNGKAGEELRWSPEVSFDDGTEKMVKWAIGGECI